MERLAVSWNGRNAFLRWWRAVAEAKLLLRA
jgi:hypothetical protein